MPAERSRDAAKDKGEIGMIKIAERQPNIKVDQPLVLEETYKGTVGEKSGYFLAIWPGLVWLDHPTDYWSWDGQIPGRLSFDVDLERVDLVLTEE